jgi:AraC-like DNA-binding protein
MAESKGHLTPGSPGVTLERFDATPELGELVRHMWIARWDLPDGVTSTQRVLTYPAFNLVLSPGAVELYGPSPKLSLRTLSGSSWTVGLLLRPAAGTLLSPVAPAALLSSHVRICGPESSRALTDLTRAVNDRAPAQVLLESLRSWLEPIAARVTDVGRVVNRAFRLAEEDPHLVRVEELARRVGVSRRSLERLTLGYVGVTPKWLIECRRLQEAAGALHQKPDTDLTRLAQALGYVDYAHFSRAYKKVLGETPDQSRARAAERAQTAAAS